MFGKFFKSAAPEPGTELVVAAKTAASTKKDGRSLRCTYCNGTEFFEGPSGGLSVNVLCANPKCRHWFNWTGMAGLLEDQERVEPTEAEKVHAREERVLTAKEEAEARYEEGRAAFLKGVSYGDLRKSEPYGGYAEASWNIDRLVGYLDAMAEKIR